MSEIPETQSADADHKARRVEILISTLLRVGVIASLLVVVFGIIVTFTHHPEYIHSRQDLARLTTRSRADFPHTFREIIVGLGRCEGRSIVMLGLLLLIATPVMRVAASIFAFVYERDRIFVIVTSIVLALLLLSFFLGQATS